MCKAAGRPFPTLDSDPVIDYLITEALSAKVAKDDERLHEEAAKRKEVAEWKADKRGLEEFR